MESLEWYRTNLGTPCNVLGAALGNKTSQRMNNGESLVSRTDRAFALFLQGIEEEFQCLSRQVGYQKLVDCFFLLNRQKRYEQSDPISVALLRVVRQVAVAHQMF